MISKEIFRSSAHSFAIVITILAGLLLKTAFAEYDCSAKDDGWYYDPEFCHIYWRCIHGTAEEFECASGTAWDHHANRCNWLDSIDCTRSEKTTPKTLSDDYDDDQPLTGENNEGDGDDGDQPPTVVKKRKKKKKKHTKIDSNKRMLENNKADDINDKQHFLLLFVYQIHSSSDFLCAGRDGFFAHPEYCTRYYRCSHGMNELFECPRGTAWDEFTKSCAWVDQVNCDQKILGYSTSTPSEDTTTSNKKSDVESALPDSNLVPGTNGKDSSGSSPTVECQPTGIYSLPDPNDCSGYYQCDKGVQTKINCTDRRLFDIEKRECNDYERVFCGTRPINPADKNQCVNKRDGVHPDTERDCHYYYQCIGQNKMREAKCVGDQKFSSYTGRCGPASNAPSPCGSFIPGNTAITNHAKNGLYIQIILLMIIFMKF